MEEKRPALGTIGQKANGLTSLAVFLRDEFRCAACGESMHDSDPSYICLDRIDVNGDDDPKNLFTCCKLCRNRRRGRSAEAFLGESLAKIRERNGKIGGYVKLSKSMLKQYSGGGGDARRQD